MTRAFQGMGLALLAAYLYSLATMIIIGGAIGGIGLLGTPMLFVAAALALLPFPILGIGALGLFAGIVVGHCASFRPVNQAWVEGAFIGGLFGGAAAGLLALYFNLVWGRHSPGSFSMGGLLWPIIPYSAVWGSIVEAWWARSEANGAGPA